MVFPSEVGAKRLSMRGLVPRSFLGVSRRRGGKAPYSLPSSKVTHNGFEKLFPLFYNSFFFLGGREALLSLKKKCAIDTNNTSF